MPSRRSSNYFEIQKLLLGDNEMAQSQDKSNEEAILFEAVIAAGKGQKHDIALGKRKQGAKYQIKDIKPPWRKQLSNVRMVEGSAGVLRILRRQFAETTLRFD